MASSLSYQLTCPWMILYVVPDSSESPAKPFNLYPVDAAGNLMTEDYPDWLRHWKGRLSKEEIVAYNRLVPGGVRRFDDAKKIFKASRMEPLTKYLDKKGARIFFRDEWDMAVAEHVRFIIECERSRQRSSNDFTYSREKENEGPNCSLLSPTPIPSFNIPEINLVLTPRSLNYATATQVFESPKNRALRWLQDVNAIRFAKDSALASANHHGLSAAEQQLRGEIFSGSHADFLFNVLSNFTNAKLIELRECHAMTNMPTLATIINLVGSHLLSKDQKKRILSYIKTAGRSTFGVPAPAGPPAPPEPPAPAGPPVPAEVAIYHDEDELDSSSDEEDDYPVMIGLHGPFLMELLTNTKNASLRLVIDMFLQTPNTLDLQALLYTNLLSDNQKDSLNRYLDELVTRSDEYPTAVAGLDATAARTAASQAAVIAESSPNSAPPAYFDPFAMSQNSASCKYNLDSMIKSATIARARALAKTMFKSDMVHKLDETASLELAKQFLNAPNAMFLLHDTYKKRGEECGDKSVPCHLVSPQALATGSFSSFDLETSRALAETADDSFVKDWRRVLRETEEHTKSHIESLRLLQHHYRTNRRAADLMRQHASCMKICGSKYRMELKKHRTRMDTVSPFMTRQQRDIGMRLLEVFESFVSFTIRAQNFIDKFL